MLMFVRDDEMVNSNVNVFYDAPSVKHPDYYGFLVLKHMMGEYNIQRAQHLNDSRKQYNALHVILGELPDVTQHSAIYNAYSDCGLFGNYFFGNEIFTRQMNWAGAVVPTTYAHIVNDVECVRARNSIYNEMMNREHHLDINEEIGQ